MSSAETPLEAAARPRETPSVGTRCPLCDGAATAVAAYAWRCRSCGVRYSSLEPHIDATPAGAVDEEKRSAGLRAVRERSAVIVLDAIAAERPQRDLSLLDVGSGHGWFLEMAAARGLRATGIEPDRAVAARARARGLDVNDGFFPADLPADELFDVVTFNDVFEHLPDPVAILAAVRARLRAGGLLAISIPTADGLAYRIASGLGRLGLGAPLDRLWQRGLPSPHLWYFTAPSLRALVVRNGFEPVAEGRLPSVERRGLRERLEADPRSGPLARVSLVGVACATPLLNHPRFSDAMWLLFRRAGDD